VGVADPKVAFSYIQFGLNDQDPTEPYFNGSYFINLGKTAGTKTIDMQLKFSASKTYATTVKNSRIMFDAQSDTLWMPTEEKIGLNRADDGSHREFPFDSATFDFDMTYTPSVTLYQFILRNKNPSFSIPCKEFSVSNISPGKAHFHFVALRNQFVRLTAVILVGAGSVFLVAIVFFVKRESLPTSVASYFFSLWSIRSILSSEIKTFPTYLDYMILCLCVSLLILLGFRLAFKELGIFQVEQGKIGFR